MHKARIIKKVSVTSVVEECFRPSQRPHATILPLELDGKLMINYHQDWHSLMLLWLNWNISQKLWCWCSSRLMLDIEIIYIGTLNISRHLSDSSDIIVSSPIQSSMFCVLLHVKKGTFGQCSGLILWPFSKVYFSSWNSTLMHTVSCLQRDLPSTLGYNQVHWTRTLGQWL